MDAEVIRIMADSLVKRHAVLVNELNTAQSIEEYRRVAIDLSDFAHRATRELSYLATIAEDA